MILSWFLPIWFIGSVSNVLRPQESVVAIIAIIASFGCFLGVSAYVTCVIVPRIVSRSGEFDGVDGVGVITVGPWWRMVFRRSQLECIMILDKQNIMTADCLVFLSFKQRYRWILISLSASPDLNFSQFSPR